MLQLTGQPSEAVATMETVMITSLAGASLGAVAVLAAAVRRGKLRELTSYWRDTVRDGLGGYLGR
jgi:hypothetical protein